MHAEILHSEDPQASEFRLGFITRVPIAWRVVGWTC